MACGALGLTKTQHPPATAEYVRSLWASLDLRFAAVYAQTASNGGWSECTRIKFRDPARGEVKGWLRLNDRGFYLQNGAGVQYLKHMGYQYVDLKYRKPGMKRWRPFGPTQEAICAYYKLRGPLT